MTMSLKKIMNGNTQGLSYERNSLSVGEVLALNITKCSVRDQDHDQVSQL